jgi:hypothetical protein
MSKYEEIKKENIIQKEGPKKINSKEKAKNRSKTKK